MAQLKRSTIEKTPHIKSGILKEPGIQYQDFEDINMNDPKMVEELIRNISLLDKQSHKEIYLTIRKFKSNTFFAANNVDTRFNIYGLNAKERKELYQMVNFCLQDLERKKVLKQATKEHSTELEYLEHKLYANDAKELPNTEIPLPVNPSEVDKIKDMLNMNSIA